MCTQTSPHFQTIADAEAALDRADFAILRHLVFAVQTLNAARADLTDTDPEFIAHRAGRVAVAAATVDALREVAHKTRTATRNPALVAEALTGDDSNLYH